MSATNASERLGLGLLGALLAGGLLLAVCAAPDGRARGADPGDAGPRHPAPVSAAPGPRVPNG
ncbi:hypothetical protein ABZZ20_07715 [Streptomyces sp. NPDC006430]|uniref:hypothetical protein n=1 Tax=Streptomyces sp. NPDC006430 TaxID=3154299 RepID=UPI00339FD4C8